MEIMMTIDNLLPVEITTDILSRIPADLVIQCKLVCKTWRTIMDDPVFVHTHTRRLIKSLFDSDDDDQKKENHSVSTTIGFYVWIFHRNPVCTIDDVQLHFGEYNDEGLIRFKLSNKITDHPFPCTSIDWNTVSSCNGLIFRATIHRHNMLVFNPFTREYVHLPRNLSLINLREPVGIASGFGYHPSTNEYKVVIIYYSKPYRFPAGHVIIYTLGSGTWRYKGKISHNLCLNTAVLLNGSLHWLTNKEKIVCFDLANEEFRILVPPPPLIQQPFCPAQLGLLGGCLLMIRTGVGVLRYGRYCRPILYVWVMEKKKKKKKKKKNCKEEEEEESSWSKRYIIEWPAEVFAIGRFVGILKSGKILFHCGKLRTFVTYDPKTKSFEQEYFHPQPVRDMHIFPYMKTFVSLKALGENIACPSDGKFCSLF